MGIVDSLNVPIIDVIDDDAELAALENAFDGLASIVSMRRQAVKYRLAGDIECALSYERGIERAYNRLPHWTRK